MKNVTVAKRYARALYELAVEHRELNDVQQALANLSQAIRESATVERILVNPLLKPAEKETLFKTFTSNKILLRFLSLLSRRKRLDLLPLIDEQLRCLADEASGLKRVLVKTATTLTDDQRRDIERTLSSVLGGQVMGRYEVTGELLGGMWIQMGSKVLDVSLRGRFEDLKQYLAHSAN